MRCLELLGYNVKGWMERLEKDVLEEEHYGSTNECDHCLEKYHKDGAGRSRPRPFRADDKG
jgi:hypothetical protein